MLCLSRKKGEAIVCDIGGGRTIVFNVLDFRSGGRVRIGVAAPEDVPIHRLEAPSEQESHGISEASA